MDLTQNLELLLNPSLKATQLYHFSSALADNSFSFDSKQGYKSNPFAIFKKNDENLYLVLSSSLSKPVFLDDLAENENNYIRLFRFDENAREEYIIKYLRAKSMVQNPAVFDRFQDYGVLSGIIAIGTSILTMYQIYGQLAEAISLSGSLGSTVLCLGTAAIGILSFLAAYYLPFETYKITGKIKNTLMAEYYKTRLGKIDIYEKKIAVKNLLSSIPSIESSS